MRTTWTFERKLNYMFENCRLMYVHLVNAVKYYCIERPRTEKLINIAGLRVLSSMDTISHIIKTGCSVARFGDGEFMIAFGGSICFQQNSSGLQEEIQRVLSSRQDNLLVCIPQCLSAVGRNRFLPVHARAWDRLALEFIPKIIELFNRDYKGIVFGDANISRPYMIFKHRDEHANMVFNGLKRLWHSRDILIVEGAQSRLGVGNDLFAGAKSVRRILCPPVNAYDHISEIENSVIAHVRGALILIALGPTATVLAARLARHDLQAIDIGHVDVEYMWYKMRANKKVPIPGKYVHEALDANGNILSCKDPQYIQSIVDAIL